MNPLIFQAWAFPDSSNFDECLGVFIHGGQEVTSRPSGVRHKPRNLALNKGN